MQNELTVKANNSPPNVIEMRNVSKVFSREAAVQNLSFSIPEGVIVGFIGPSGSGKTTSVRLMTGIYQPSEGEVRVFGKDPSTFNSREREEIGYMTQLFTLDTDLSVKENMNFAAALYGYGWLSRRKPIKKLLDFVELSDAKSRLARKLSGGMQKRLSLAAAMVHDPKLLFLDEPTAGIDPILRRKFWDHFEALKAEGKTLVVTTQYVNEAAYCDLVAVMADGKLVMLDTPENLVRNAYGGEMLNLQKKGLLRRDELEELSSLPSMVKPLQVRPDGEIWFVVDDASKALPEVMNWLNAHEVEVISFEQYHPPYDDVFVKIIEDYNAGMAAEAQAMEAGVNA